MPLEEVFSVLRKKKSTPKPSAGNKGKEIEAEARRNRKKLVPSRRPREIVIGSSIVPLAPPHVL